MTASKRSAARSKSYSASSPQPTKAAPRLIEAQAPAPSLGARVRHLRQDRSWNLAELSRRSGIAVSTLSKVENGVLSLTYDRLLKVAQAFELTLSEFLSEDHVTPETRARPTARISWARKAGGTEIDTPNYLYRYLCENLRKKAMVPVYSQCRARTLSEFGPLLRHEGEEFVFVVKGCIEVHTECYEAETLEAGEGVYLDSRMGHAYLNAAEDDDTWIISVNHQLGPRID